ncbi:MAG: recombinase family protein [Rhodoferax sp.]|nr:recombinase family protein [Rhodoferax sp.]
MLVGYSRVSTDDQNLDLQTDALTNAGCEQLFSDKLSGTVTNREGLAQALAYVRPGDTLVVWKLDRLGRTVKGLIEFVDQLKEREVQFRSLTDGIDTSTTAGRFFIHVMAALAQMERELIRERTNAGLAAARARGRLGGRKPKLDASKLESARTLLAAKVEVGVVAKNLGVSRTTLYRALAKLPTRDSRAQEPLDLLKRLPAN